jgi:hypothetical protein
MRAPSNITLIIAVILFLLAAIVWVALGQSNFEILAESPPIPKAPPIPKGLDPLRPQALLPAETHASFRIDWIWPTNIAEYGPIPIADVATNFTFLIFSSPLLSNPEWKLKYAFPGKNMIPKSNYWYTNIFEDMSTSAYFQIVVTNDLNRTTSTTTSIPSPTATSMLLSTPMAKVTSIIKN